MAMQVPQYVQANDPTLPANISNQMANRNALYNSLISKPPSGASQIGMGLLGLLLGGPAGAIALPMGNARRSQAQRMKELQLALEMAKTDAYTQNQLQGTREGYANNRIGSTLANNSGFESPFDPNMIVSNQTMQNTMNGITANQDMGRLVPMLAGIQSEAIQRNYNAIDGMRPNPNQQQASPSSGTSSSEPRLDADPALTGRVTSDSGPQPLRRPVWMNPDLAKEGINTAGSILNQAGQTAIGMYKAPSEVRENNATAAYTDVKAQYHPEFVGSLNALRTAQTNASNVNSQLAPILAESLIDSRGAAADYSMARAQKTDTERKLLGKKGANQKGKPVAANKAVFDRIKELMDQYRQGDPTQQRNAIIELNTLADRYGTQRYKMPGAGVDRQSSAPVQKQSTIGGSFRDWKKSRGQ